MKKSLSVLIAITLSLVLLSGCGGSSDTPSAPPATEAPVASATTAPPESAPPEEVSDGRTEFLTIAITRDENSLTPVTYVSGSPGFDTMKFLYDSLFAISAENTVIPWMVEDGFEVSADFKEYKMTLLDGQMWHDGTPLTADDVVFTFEYFRDTYTHSRWTPIASKLDSISAAGNEITILLKESDPGFMRSALADMRIIAKSAYEGADDPTTVPNMGSGAYRLAGHKTDESYTLEAMDGYFRGIPKVKTIRMPIISDITVIQQAMLAGELAAFTGSISPELVEQFNAADGIRVEQSDGYVSTLLFMNNERAPFDDRDFRNAVSLAIDLDTIVNQVCLGFAQKGTAGYVRGGLDEHVAGLDYSFDTDAANELLDSAGYNQKNSSGMRLNKDGGEMRLEILAAASSAQRIRTAEIIVQQLAAVGIDAYVTSLDSDAVTERVWPGFDTAAPHDYDMVIFGWSAPVIQRAGTIVGACSSDYSGAGGQNLPHYVSAEFDALAQEFLASADASERARLNEEMQKIVARDTPFVTLFFADMICAVNEDMYDGWVFAKGMTAVNLYSFVG